MKDLLGREISVGDVVAISVKSRGENYVRIGKVLELRPYDYECGTWREPKIETRIGAFIEVFAGNGYYSMSKRNFDSVTGAFNYEPVKSYRKVYRNEKNIVLVEKHWLRIRELEEQVSAMKINEAKKKNDASRT